MSNRETSPDPRALGDSAPPAGHESEWQALENDERRQLVTRIVQSRAFARSPRLREFLMFTAVKTLSGHASDVTEVEIGRRIFGRGEDFAPLDDSVVRGGARQLRAKIKEYYELEGAGEAWLLEIPKGGYVPVFLKRDVGRETAPERLAPPRRGWIGAALFAAAALNLLLLGLNLWWVGGGRAPAPPEARPTLLSVFAPPGTAPTQIVVSDFSLVLMYALSKPGLTLDEYSRSDYRRLQAGVEPGSRFQRLFDVLRTHRLTRLGDLNGVAAIQKSLANSTPLVIRHARDAGSRNFKTGRHILLGNPLCTPWIDLFQDRLNFPDIRDGDAVGYGNLSPKPGEPAAYAVTADEARKEDGRGYARIAFVPNLSGTDGILLLSGVNMVTMEAACEYAADPEALPELMRALGRAPGGTLPYFEAVLETHAVDNTPRRSLLKTTRSIGSVRAR